MSGAGFALWDYRLSSTLSHSFILPLKDVSPLPVEIFLLSPHTLFLSPFCRKTIPSVLSPALYTLSCSCNFSSLCCVILPVFSSVSSHVVSLYFPHSSVCSEDVHTSLSIPLLGGSLMHERAPTSAPRGTPLLTSHRYPICIHLSPLSNLSNLGY